MLLCSYLGVAGHVSVWGDRIQAKKCQGGEGWVQASRHSTRSSRRRQLCRIK